MFHLHRFMNINRFPRILASWVLGKGSTRSRGALGLALFGLVFGSVVSVGSHPAPLLGQGFERVLPPKEIQAPGATMRGWSIDQGLPQGSVRQLIVEEQGFIWGATAGGLFRFDGQNVIPFTLAELPLLVSNRVTALGTARGGGVWIAGEGGSIFRVRAGREDRVLPPIYPFPHSINAVHEDSDEQIWVLTQSTLHRLVDDSWMVIDRVPYSQVSRIFHQDSIHGLLLAGTDAGRKVVGDRVISFEGPEGGRDGGILSYFRDPDGVLWVGTRTGLHYQRPDGLWGKVPGIEGPIFGLANCVISGLWALSTDRTFRFDLPRKRVNSDGTLIEANLEVLDLPFERAETLVVTRDGVIVVGFVDGGFVTITPRVIRSMADLGPDELRFPHSVVHDGMGGVWLSRDALGLIHVAAGAFDRRSDPPLNPEDWRRHPVHGVRSLAVDERGRLWVGRPQFLSRLAPGGMIDSVSVGPASTPDPIGERLRESGRFPRALLAVGPDSMVAGYNDGVLLLLTEDGKSIERYPLWPAAEVNDITGLAKGPDGTLWVGGRSVLFRGLGVGFQALTTADGVPSGDIRAIRPVAQGVWVGGYGGGVHFLGRDGRVTSVPLEDTSVSGFLASPDGALWIFQNSGLVSLTSETVERIESGEGGPIDVRRFRSWDGVPEANNGSPPGVVLPDGRFVLATLGGVVVFDPTLLPPPATTPGVQLASIRTPLRRIWFPEGTVRLARGERSVDLDYSLPAYRESDLVRTRYRLNGRGPWVELGARRSLQLASLLPGTQRVEVEARLPDGNWRSLPPITLKVEGGLLEMGWFQALLLGLLVFFGAVTVAHTLRIQRLQAYRFQSQLELEQAERDREAVYREELARVGRLALAGEMAAAMAHEVSQPVAALVQDGAVAKLLLSRKEVPLGQLHAVVEAMIGQGERARVVIQGLRRFLLNEETPSGTFEITELLASLESVVRSELRDLGIRLNVEIEPDTPQAHGDRGMIQQVLINLVSNSAQALTDVPWGHREIRIRARRVGGHVRISVADRGRGIHPTDRPSVFQPFFTTHPGGMGIGLPVVRRIVLAHGGSIRLRSVVGQGTVFTITLPPSDSNQQRTLS